MPMGKTAYNLVYAFLFICLIDISAQSNQSYDRGVASLNSKDTTSAEAYFKESIEQKRDAASYYELGNIQFKRSTFNSRNFALDNFSQAVLRDPDNVKYRLSLARLKIEMSSFFGIEELDRLLPEGIQDIQIMVEIADIYEGLFEKYLNLNLNGNPLYEADQNWVFENKNFRDYAEIFYIKAQTFYLKALSKNIYDGAAVLGYTRLCAINGAYGKAIYFLEKLYEKKPDIKDLNLYLGMYYYKITDFAASWKYFDKALSLMDEEENKVYTYTTVIAFLDNEMKKQLLNKPLKEQKKLIKKYWDSKDPLFLSSENERLVEHYYRVAYSNFFLSVPRLNIPGWKTDRGKVFVSFGDPEMKYKLGGGRRKAEIRETWYYSTGRTIHFDSKMYDDFKIDWRDDFVGIRIPPVPRIETSADIYDKEKVSRFSISELKTSLRYLNPLAINLFRSLTNPSESQIYFSYMLPIPFAVTKEEHLYGLFLMNKQGEFILNKTGTVEKKYISKILDEKRPNYQNINTVMANTVPSDVRFSFETKILNNEEKVSTLQKDFRIVKFKKDTLDLSGIVVASKVSEGTEMAGAIKRNDIFIIPKIGSQFTPKEETYIYYEVYNLSKVNDLTDFEQTIIIRESDPVETGIPILKMFRSISEMITDSKNRVSLTSSFKTKEVNTQIYQQIDLSAYKPGKYDLFVVVQDKITGQKTERKCSLEIVNGN